MAFLYLPIAILVIYSFNDSRLVTVWGGWSVRWYGELLADAPLINWRRGRWFVSAGFAAGCCSPP